MRFQPLILAVSALSLTEALNMPNVWPSLKAEDVIVPRVAEAAQRHRYQHKKPGKDLDLRDRKDERGDKMVPGEGFPKMDDKLSKDEKDNKDEKENKDDKQDDKKDDQKDDQKDDKKSSESPEEPFTTCTASNIGEGCIYSKWGYKISGVCGTDNFWGKDHQVCEFWIKDDGSDDNKDFLTSCSKETYGQACVIEKFGYKISGVCDEQKWWKGVYQVCKFWEDVEEEEEHLH